MIIVPDSMYHEELFNAGITAAFVQEETAQLDMARTMLTRSYYVERYMRLSKGRYDPEEE